MWTGEEVSERVKEREWSQWKCEQKKDTEYGIGVTEASLSGSFGASLTLSLIDEAFVLASGSQK